MPNAKGYKFVSTKTSDRNEAVRLAMNFYDELYHHIKVGGSIKSNTLADVFKEWKNSRRKVIPPEISGVQKPNFFGKIVEEIL